MTHPIVARQTMRLIKHAKSAVVSGLNYLQDSLPPNRRSNAARQAERARAEALMANLAENGASNFQGLVLIDGMFDNANYWYRASLLRAALGLGRSNEIGLYGPYMANYARRTFDRFSIDQHIAFDGKLTPNDRSDARRLTKELISATSQPDDILSWRLPFEVPAGLVYDGILKVQRAPSVDTEHPLFADQVERCLLDILAAARLFDHLEPNLVILSHSCNVSDGTLCHLAARRGTPAIVAFGNYGVPRYCRVNTTDQLFDPVDRPSGQDLEMLMSTQAEALAEAGRQHLQARFDGATDDAGGQFAFAKENGNLTRAGVTAQFGWGQDRPIVAVYAANWFDYPHYMGMSNFRDFADFIMTTVRIAIGCPEVNWLFRRHPADDFYGGKTLKDVMPASLPPHVALSPNDWNGSELMCCIDGAVTYHGTIGIEAATIGKPVLVADRGWYHDCGFVTCPENREAYCAALKDRQWLNVDVESRRHNAEIFAGWYFAVPRWQGRLMCGDDTGQWANYGRLSQLMMQEGDAIQREIEQISSWWSSGARFYHTEKMRHADAFKVGNVHRDEDTAAS